MMSKRFVALVVSYAMLLSAVLLSVVGSVSAKTAFPVKLSPAKKNVSVGSKVTIQAKCKKSYVKKLRWSLSNSKLAVIKKKSGKKLVVKTKKAGTVKVIAKLKGMKGKVVCTLKITENSQGSETQIPKPTTAATASAAASTPTGGQPQTVPSNQPQPTATPVAGKDVDSSIFIVATQSSITQDGKLETAYLINKKYKGDISIQMGEHRYTTNDSARNLIVGMSGSATTKENSDGSIRVSRASLAEEYWTVEDVSGGKTYLMRSVNNNNSKGFSFMPEYADCGVIYIIGDADGDIRLYAGKD